MFEKEMPVGNPIEFEENILDTEIIKQVKINYPDYFQEPMAAGPLPYGFFEVESPKDLFIPILQKRFKIKNAGGFRTIAPLGT